MKQITTKLLLLAFVVLMNGILYAQNAPIDFESGGYGADWTWTVFENDTNPAVEIIANPDASGINSSSTVAKITALVAGQPWVGCESLHGSDIGTFSFDATNSTVKVMVYKSVISDVGIKFVEASGDAQPEVKVANTLINQWEELTFDLSGSIGAGANGIIDQIVIFPDFDLGGRTTENVIYFDNITFSGEVVPPSGPTEAAPTPTDDEANVISIYSDAYTDVAGTDFNPNWGQATVASEVMIVGNATLKYANLNYQGTQLGTSQDVSSMNHLHVDFWTANSTALNVSLISTGPVETAYALPVSLDSWVSVDIPLTEFSSVVDLADVIQLKIDGNGDIYMDNLYFSSSPVSIEEIQGEAPTSYTLEQNYPNPFNPSTMIKYGLPETSNIKVEIFNMLGQSVGVLVNAEKSAGLYETTWNATNLPSGIYLISIRAEGLSSKKNFTQVKKALLLK